MKIGAVVGVFRCFGNERYKMMKKLLLMRQG